MTDNGNTKMDADDKFVMYKALATAEERKMEIDKLNRENDKLKREKEELEARLKADNQMDGNDKIEMYEALAIAEERKMEVDRLSREKEELAEKLKKMEVIREASPSTSKGDNGQDGLLALFLEEDEQERLFQEWKQQLSLKKVKEILGKDLMRNEDLTRLLTKLKDPVTRANFNRWCEEADTSSLLPEEPKFRLASPKVAPEKSVTLVHDGFVYVQKQPAAPAPGERNDSLGRGGSAEKQPPSDQDIVDGNNSLVPPGNNSWEGKQGSTGNGSLKGSNPRGTKILSGGRGIKAAVVSTTKSKPRTLKAPTTDSESEAEDAPKKTKVLPEAGLDTYNILVVGDSGVGKTTFINGLANYFEYSKWEENMENGPNVRINTQFTIVNLDNKPVTVVSKSSYEATREERNNENLGGQGESVTQKPVTHTFLMEREKRFLNVNVIDTPGLSDTRGARQDHMSIQKIIEHIRELKQLNAIVLLLTADQRMTSQFRHSLNELLTLFDKESLKNLFFCYTRTRPFNYKPGDAVGTLREYLDELSKRSGVSIPLEKGNVFCIDNDCFRYLCLVDQFPDCESQNLNKEFGECWTQTRRELNRLLKKVTELRPYKLDASTDLSKLRQMVNALALPQGEIAKLNAFCVRDIDNTFSQMQEQYKNVNYHTPTTSRDARAIQKRQLPHSYNIQQLEKQLAYYQEKQEEMKKDRYVILALCAEIHVHISYKSLAQPADEFRLKLIEYIEDAERRLQQGGGPRLVKDLQAALHYYEEKVMEISKEVEEKKRNILTEFEIETKMNELQLLSNYQQLLSKTIAFR